jgi:uncharacterized membrane protein YeiH
MVVDAFALAAFAMIGTQKGIVMQFSAPVSVLLGVVTGVAGGILRDVLIGEVPMVFRPEIRLYATAALAGAALVFGLRLAGICWNISLPIFETKRDK